MNTFPTALPAPTSKSHLTVPSADWCSLTTGKGNTWRNLELVPQATSPDRSSGRNPARRAGESNGTIGLRENAFPSCSQKAVSLSRSKSSRLIVMSWIPVGRSTRHRKAQVPWPCLGCGICSLPAKTMSAGVNVQAGKEECHFHLGGFCSVRTVHRVGIDAVGKVGADGARAAFLGSVAPISSRFLRMAFSPSRTWIMTGPETMKSTRS